MNRRIFSAAILLFCSALGCSKRADSAAGKAPPTPEGWLVYEDDWIKTIYPGIRYRESATRKHLGKPDKYFVIRYQNNEKKEIVEPVGWASENDLNATKVNAIRSELVAYQNLGKHKQIWPRPV